MDANSRGGCWRASPAVDIPRSPDSLRSPTTGRLYLQDPRAQPPPPPSRHQSPLDVGGKGDHPQMPEVMRLERLDPVSRPSSPACDVSNFIEWEQMLARAPDVTLADAREPGLVPGLKMASSSAVRSSAVAIARCEKAVA